MVGNEGVGATGLPPAPRGHQQTGVYKRVARARIAGPARQNQPIPWAHPGMPGCPQCAGRADTAICRCPSGWLLPPGPYNSQSQGHQCHSPKPDKGPKLACGTGNNRHCFSVTAAALGLDVGSHWVTEGHPSSRSPYLVAARTPGCPTHPFSTSPQTDHVTPTTGAEVTSSPKPSSS